MSNGSSARITPAVDEALWRTAILHACGFSVAEASREMGLCDTGAWNNIRWHRSVWDHRRDVAAECIRASGLSPPRPRRRGGWRGPTQKVVELIGKLAATIAGERDIHQRAKELKISPGYISRLIKMYPHLFAQKCAELGFHEEIWGEDFRGMTIENRVRIVRAARIEATGARLGEAADRLIEQRIRVTHPEATPEQITALIANALSADQRRSDRGLSTLKRVHRKLFDSLVAKERARQLMPPDARPIQRLETPDGKTYRPRKSRQRPPGSFKLHWHRKKGELRYGKRIIRRVDTARAKNCSIILESFQEQSPASMPNSAKLCHWWGFGLKVNYCLLISLQGGKDRGSSVAEGCGVGRGGVGGFRPVVWQMRATAACRRSSTPSGLHV